MQITIDLSDKETAFLQRLINENKALYQREWTMEDAVRECIRDSMFDEGERGAKEEFEA
jgi:hypothetical protein